MINLILGKYKVLKFKIHYNEKPQSFYKGVYIEQEGVHIEQEGDYVKQEGVHIEQKKPSILNRELFIVLKGFILNVPVIFT